MKVIRQYLINDTILMTLLDNRPAIFYAEKPFEYEADTYIVYLFKPVSGGFIKDYQFEFRVIGKDINKILNIQNRLITLLDTPRSFNSIKDDSTTIRSSSLLNGGGIVKNPDTDNFEQVVFFLLTI